MRSAPEGAYVIWILVSTAALLQALASYYGWAGLSFFAGRPRLGYLCAAVVAPASYYWFFSLANRNAPGLEGWQLFSRFIVGAVGGVAAALLLSSLLNASLPRRRPENGQPLPPVSGLDNLRYEPFLRLVADAVRQMASKREHKRG
jgi:hypothetical protein